MTHSVNGNIIAHGRFSEYDKGLINSIVAEFSGRSGSYIAAYDRLHGITTYSSDGKSSPFIRVLDNSTIIKWRPNAEIPPLDRYLSLFISIESGSHVSISDTEYVEDVYNTTIGLHRLFRRKRSIKRELHILFDDENKIYVPSEFKKGLLKQPEFC